MSKIKYDTIATESGEYKTTLNKMFRSRKSWKPANQGEILSFMPGMIEEFRVKVGDSVKQGDCLLIFRAMKMSNRVLSPINGRVKRLSAEAGVNLPKHALLMELE